MITVEKAYDLVKEYMKVGRNFNGNISYNGCFRYKKYYIFPVNDIDDDVYYFVDGETEEVVCENMLFHPVNVYYEDYVRNVEHIRFIDGNFVVVGKGLFALLEDED